MVPHYPRKKKPVDNKYRNNVSHRWGGKLKFIVTYYLRIIKQNICRTTKQNPKKSIINLSKTCFVCSVIRVVLRWEC